MWKVEYTPKGSMARGYWGEKSQMSAIAVSVSAGELYGLTLRSLPRY